MWEFALNEAPYPRLCQPIRDIISKYDFVKANIEIIFHWLFRFALLLVIGYNDLKGSSA